MLDCKYVFSPIKGREAPGWLGSAAVRDGKGSAVLIWPSQGDGPCRLVSLIELQADFCRESEEECQLCGYSLLRVDYLKYNVCYLASARSWGKEAFLAWKRPISERPADLGYQRKSLWAVLLQTVLPFFHLPDDGRLLFVFEKCDRRPEHTHIVASLGFKQIMFSRSIRILVGQALMKMKAVQKTSMCRLLNAVVCDPEKTP